MLLIAAIIIMINAIGFFNMGFDKRQAVKGNWRTPESRFFLYAFFGGAIGVLLGMRFWHHKTKHLSFQIGIPLMILWNIVAAFIFMYVRGMI